MSLKEDLWKAMFGKAADDWEYEESEHTPQYGDEDDAGTQRSWKNESVVITAKPNEHGVGWDLNAGDFDALESVTLLGGADEEDAVAAGGWVAENQSPRDVAAAATETVGEDVGWWDDMMAATGASGDDMEVGDTEAPGGQEEGEASTDLGADVSELLGGAESPSESEADDGGDAPDEADDDDTGEAGAETGDPGDDPDGASESGAGGQNPWVQYQGNAGGQGWQNVITGEIRYQEEQPAPTEGEQEAMDEQAAMAGDSGLSQGDWVSVDTMGGEVSGQIKDYDPDTDRVFIEDEDGGVYAHKVENVEPDPSAAAAQEPDEGFADGWQAPPDDFSDVQSGDYAEVYDTETGEWHIGQVLDVAQDDYLRIRTEEGEEYEILRGSDTGAVLTAVEESIEGVPMDLEMVHELEQGDDVLYDSPGADGLIPTSVVAGYDDFADSVQVEDYDGEYTTIFADDAVNALYADPPEWRDWAFGDDPEAVERFEGKYVRYDHPSRGIVTGELQVSEGPDGETWFHIKDDDNGEGENCSGWTANPAHPLGPDAVEMVAADDPFDQWFESRMKDVKPGDIVMADGESHVVGGVSLSSGVLGTETGEQLAATPEAADQHDLPLVQEAWIPETPIPDPPEGAEAWEEPGEYAEGDYIWYVNDDHEAVVSQVTETIPELDTVQTETDTVDMGLIHGRADGELLTIDDIEAGNFVTYRRENADGEWEEFGGVVIAQNDNNPYQITVSVQEGGEGTYEVDMSQDNYELLNLDQDYDQYEHIENNGMEMDPVNVAQDIIEDAGIDLSAGTRLEKSALLLKWWSGKAEQQTIRNQLSAYFPEAEVDKFYHSIDQHKWSGDKPETDWSEAAFKEAFDLKSRVRGHGEDDTGHDVPLTDEAVQIASVMGAISREFFDQSYGGSTVYKRSCINSSQRSLMFEFLENPEADEYNVSGLATNKGVPEAQYGGTASWNNWSFTTDIETDQVVLMTDYVFNPMWTNAGENEMWAHADGMTVKPENIRFGNKTGSENSLGGQIEDWSATQTARVADEFEIHGSKLLGTHDSEDGIIRDDEFSDAQVETMVRMAEKFDAENVNAPTFTSMAKSLAEERGIDVPEVTSTDFPSFDEWASLDISPEDGVPVQWYDEYQQETVQGEVVAADDGYLQVWDEMDLESDIDPEDITWVDEVELENAKSSEGASEPDGSDTSEWMNAEESSATATHFEPVADAPAKPLHSMPGATYNVGPEAVTEWAGDTLPAQDFDAHPVSVGDPIRNAETGAEGVIVGGDPNDVDQPFKVEWEEDADYTSLWPSVGNLVPPETVGGMDDGSGDSDPPFPEDMAGEDLSHGDTFQMYVDDFEPLEPATFTVTEPVNNPETDPVHLEDEMGLEYILFPDGNLEAQ